MTSGERRLLEATARLALTLGNEWRSEQVSRGRFVAEMNVRLAEVAGALEGLGPEPRDDLGVGSRVEVTPGPMNAADAPALTAGGLRASERIATGDVT